MLYIYILEETFLGSCWKI